MIPLVPCEPADACCVSLYDIASHLLAEVYDALITCYPSPDACAPLAAYVTLGLGDDGIVDALTVASQGIVAAPSNRPGSVSLWRAHFAVILRESGWPTAKVEGEQIVFPAPDLQAAAATHVYSMGEAMHRKLVYLYNTKSLAPADVVCVNGTLGQMIPLAPRGGVVGWQVPVTVDLPWN